MGCGICHFFFVCLCSPGFPGRFYPPPGFPGCFDGVAPNPRILRFEFGNSAQQQPVCYFMSFFCILSSSQDSMHCTLSLTVGLCTPCQRASFNSTTDSFSWGHDPYTLACKARPSFDRCGTSLSVSLSLSLSLSLPTGRWNLSNRRLRKLVGGTCYSGLTIVIMAWWFAAYGSHFQFWCMDDLS